MGTFDGIKYIVVLLAKTKKYAVLDVEFDEIASDEFETKDEAVEAFEKLLGLKTDEGIVSREVV